MSLSMLFYKLIYAGMINLYFNINCLTRSAFTLDNRVRNCVVAAYIQA